MKIGVLTSSRADYGIYLPLLRKLKEDPFFKLEIIVFGTHLSRKYGFTHSEIINDQYDVVHKVSAIGDDDTRKGIVHSYSKTIKDFSNFWTNNIFDLVFCLGDRFEMSAAVQSTIPFGIKLAHIHGGETTLGAIDNVYRHQITMASKIHFVSTEQYATKVSNIIDSEENIYNVGSLSLEGIENLKLPNFKTVSEQFKIPNDDFILVTLHPETVNVSSNNKYCKVIYETFREISNYFHIVITMSNADTNGILYRKMSKKLKKNYPKRFTLVENFGKENYFSVMKNCLFLLGNTSSGIIEAASFNKYFINIGKRQLGRLQSKNVFNVDFDKNQIIDAVKKVNEKKIFIGKNKYYKSNSVQSIIEAIVSEK